MSMPVGVLSIYNPHKNTFIPHKLKWNGRYYLVKKVCYHHMVREGRTPIHVFHVTDGALDFRLAFNTETLRWTIEDIYDEHARL